MNIRYISVHKWILVIYRVNISNPDILLLYILSIKVKYRDCWYLPDILPIFTYVLIYTRYSSVIILIYYRYLADLGVNIGYISENFLPICTRYALIWPVRLITNKNASSFFIYYIIFNQLNFIIWPYFLTLNIYNLPTYRIKYVNFNFNSNPKI